MIGKHVVSIEVDGVWDGQGVIVAGEIVLTAAHCLPVPESWFSLADECIVQVQRHDGKIGRMKAIFIDAVGDIAALEMCEGDLPFLDGVEPILTSLEWSGSLSFEDRPFHPGEFFAHDNGVVAATWREIADGLATLTPDKRINGGTSGGPIVDTDGRLIGIVGNSSGAEDEDNCFFLLGAALPHRLVLRIQAAEASLS